jgi:hypothetical protein
LGSQSTPSIQYWKFDGAYYTARNFLHMPIYYVLLMGLIYLLYFHLVAKKSIANEAPK